MNGPASCNDVGETVGYTIYFVDCCTLLVNINDG